MQPVAHTFATPTALPAFAATRGHSSDVEGQRVRFAAADLFRQGRLVEADLLTQAAMEQHPDSEDVLVIRALICEVQQDWPQAAAALQRLVALQGRDVPAQSWCHWVRVLRCNGELAKARDAVLRGLDMHPAHPLLASELAQLEALGFAASAQRQAA